MRSCSGEYRERERKEERWPIYPCVSSAMSDQVQAPRKAIVCGAGPVGCLTAMALAQMGWHVDIYEGRDDLRLPSVRAAAQQRSINLAISSRGIAALEAIDSEAASRFLQTVIPMRGRMIHDEKSQQHSQPYDRDGQCINSIDRALLNVGLLDEVAALRHVRIFFKHKVTSVDFDKRRMVIRDIDGATDVEAAFDFCVGTDGSYSVIRRQLMRVVRMDYQQAYIEHEYIELRIPPGVGLNGEATFLLDPNHLHIWPRHAFMLIALPNKDKSFTCTLFAPTETFDHLRREQEKALEWFATQFPDALQLIGVESVGHDLQQKPRSPLISIKMKPYHYRDRAVLLGDAAHAMVPFYGQGLNCGLEDVRVLSTIMRQHDVESVKATTTTAASRAEDMFVDDRLAAALAQYSESRHEDLMAISDLAMENYVEMRHAVTTASYRIRKALDNLLFSLTRPRGESPSSSSFSPKLLKQVPFPFTSSSPSSVGPPGWIPLYTMVTFRPDIPYGVVRRKAGRQSRLLTLIMGVTVAAASSISGFAWLYFYLVRSRRR